MSVEKERTERRFLQRKHDSILYMNQMVIIIDAVGFIRHSNEQLTLFPQQGSLCSRYRFNALSSLEFRQREFVRGKLESDEHLSLFDDNYSHSNSWILNNLSTGVNLCRAEKFWSRLKLHRLLITVLRLLILKSSCSSEDRVSNNINPSSFCQEKVKVRKNVS